MLVFWQHDWTYLWIAALLGFLTALTIFRVYGRALQSQGLARKGWLATNAVAAGGGLWAVNFILLLSFAPDARATYGLGATLASLAVAIALSVPLPFLVLGPSARRVALTGGPYVAAGLAAVAAAAAMAYRSTPPARWDASYFLAAAIVATPFSMAALLVARPSRRWWQRALGAVCLTLAVSIAHFVPLIGLTIQDAEATAAPEGLTAHQLRWAVITVATLLIGASFLLAAMDQRTQRTARARVRELADAATEGLVLCENGIVVDANNGFLRLIGARRDAVRRVPLAAFVAPEDAAAVPTGSGPPRELRLKTLSGAYIPVEAVGRDLASRHGRFVLAIQDLRDRKAAEERIRHLAHHDALTDLPNRVTFGERLTAALASASAEGSPPAVLTFDLDRFKQVNDVFGHPCGDAVLVEVARRIRSVLEPGEHPARLGGDEFAVVQAGRPQPAGAVELAGRLLGLFETGFPVGGQCVAMSSSIGIALTPRHDSQPDELLLQADAALYRAKADGRGAYRLFDAEMDNQIRARHLLAQDLGRAVRQGELSLHYQPQVVAGTGEIVGFEALARWSHPGRGSVPPGEFIGVAEETGLILELGEWVLRQACTEAASWAAPLHVSVNLSPVQFQVGDLPERVAAILFATGLPAARLELEITETVLVKDINRALLHLRRLKALGVRIAMDDFGTGYSSLSNLQAFPFDKLKIDRSFVQTLDSQPQAAAIVRAILGLGRSLSIPIVAEGVESHRQLAFLTEEGCQEVQGYLCGRPAPISAFADLVGATGQGDAPRADRRVA